MKYPLFIFATMQKHKQNNKIGLIEFSILLTIWLVVFISPVIVHDNNDNLIWENIFQNWRRLFPFLILSLFNHFILIPFLFFRNKKLAYLGSAIAILVLFTFTLNVIQKQFPEPLPDRDNKRIQQSHRPLPPPPNRFDRNRPENHPPMRERLPHHRQANPGGLPPFLNSFIVALLIIGFDTGMRSVFLWTKSEQEKEKLEKEKVKSELAFLRNQISPHFFLNTLNNIHSLIDFDTEEAKESVIRLSKLMRHLLYDSERELIPIREEIGFIKSYVELMKIRVSDKVNINLHVSTLDEEIQIPPLLFTSLIENAFKYGISYQNNSFISMAFITTETELCFKLSNRIAPARKKEFDSHSGIGLQNTQKRLNLLYTNRYSMDIDTTDNIFSVTLKIPL